MDETIDLARIDSAAAALQDRIRDDRAILEALQRAQALAAEAWERGFEAGRDGALRPENPYR